jgi:hypothetical protein
MLQVSVFGDTIVVIDAATKYYALYGRPTQHTVRLAAQGLIRRLTLLRRGLLVISL